MEKRSNRRLRLRGVVALLSALAVAAASLSVFIEIRLRSVAVVFAKNALSSVLSTAIDTAALSLLDTYNITYDKLSVISRDSQNRVASIEINATEVNRFKSSLASAVQSELNRTGEVRVSVPLSAAFGLYYTYLAYPKISYTLSVATVISSNIKSEFFDAGINQTLHKISVRVATAGNLGLTGRDEQIEEINDFTVAETVIIGEIPDAYTKIDYANEDIVDDVFDYGAESKE